MLVPRKHFIACTESKVLQDYQILIYICLPSGCLPRLFSVYVQFWFYCPYILIVFVMSLCEEEGRQIEGRRRRRKSTYKASRRNNLFSVVFSLHCFFSGFGFLFFPKILVMVVEF